MNLIYKNGTVILLNNINNPIVANSVYSSLIHRRFSHDNLICHTSIHLFVSPKFPVSVKPSDLKLNVPF